MAQAVVDSDLANVVLDVVTALAKLGSTEIGSSIAQIGLLTGALWGGGELLRVSKILPTIASQFKALGGVLAGTATAASAALPIILGIVTAIVATTKIADALTVTYEEQQGIVADIQDKYEASKAKYDELKAKGEDLLSVEETRLAVLENQTAEYADQLKQAKQLEYEKWTSANATKPILFSDQWFAALFGDYTTNAEMVERATNAISGALTIVGARVETGYANLDNYGNELANIVIQYDDLYKALKSYEEVGVHLGQQEQVFIRLYEQNSVEVKKLKDSEAERYRQFKLYQGYTELQLEYDSHYIELLGKEREVLDKTSESTQEYTDRQIAADKALTDLINVIALANAAGSEHDSLFKSLSSTYSTLEDEFNKGRIGSNALKDSLTALVGEEEANRLVTNALNGDTKALGDRINKLKKYFGNAEDGGKAFWQELATMADESGNVNMSLSEMADRFGLTEAGIWSLLSAGEVWGYNFNLSAKDVTKNLNELGFVINQTAQGVTNIDWTGFSSHLINEVGLSEEAVQGLYEKLSSIEGIKLVGETATLNKDLDNTTSKAGTTKQALSDINGVSYGSILAGLTNINKKLLTIGTNADTVKGKLSGLNGGAQAKGTTNAPGGLTLVNEEGPEIIQSGGSAYIAGNGMPTITNLDKGDTVFTADQTKRILNNSNGLVNRLTGRGINARDFGQNNSSIGIGITAATLARVSSQQYAASTSNAAYAEETAEDFTAYINRRKHMLNMELITEQEYYDDLERIYKEYLAANKLAEEDAWQYEEDVYKFRKKQEEELADAREQEFEDWLAEKEHQLAMDIITEAEYYDALESMYKQYYEQGTEDYWKYEEEIYRFRKEQLEDENKLVEEQIELQEKLNDVYKASSKLLKVWRDGQWQYVSDIDTTAKAVEAYREAGGDMALVSGAFATPSIVSGGIRANSYGGIVTGSGINGVMSGGNNNSYSFNIADITLPNVNNADDFFSGLTAYAHQYSSSRS